MNVNLYMENTFNRREDAVWQNISLQSFVVYQGKLKTILEVELLVDLVASTDIFFQAGCIGSVLRWQ